MPLLREALGHSSWRKGVAGIAQFHLSVLGWNAEVGKALFGSLHKLPLSFPHVGNLLPGSQEGCSRAKGNTAPAGEGLAVSKPRAQPPAPSYCSQ